MTQPPTTGELVAAITGIAAQLERMASGSAFVQDGFVRVLDPPYLIDKLRDTADAITTLERELEEVRLGNDFAVGGPESEAAAAVSRIIRRSFEVDHARLVAEAALTASQAEVERLRAALKPFAYEADDIRPHTGDEQTIKLYASAGQVRAARAALHLEESKP